MFTTGNCVYQVSNHCSWPTLASLLQSLPSESPPTGNSNNGHHHNGSQEVHAHRPDSTRLAPHGWKRVAFQGCDGSCEVVAVGCSNRTGGKSQEKTYSNQAGLVKLQESATRIIFRQICAGLKHLHDHELFHRCGPCGQLRLVLYQFLSVPLFKQFI